MIYTVTFNPALDYVVKVEHFALGSVNRTIRETSFTGVWASMFRRFGKPGIQDYSSGIHCQFYGPGDRAGSQEPGI